ncbi:TetR/AcrR family transcriptional regulator [Gordonia sp. MP11Mi]|uniref:HTH tetR-type domain-containing protein n=1 Tax=Gordonia sp. MP11Mi TaxID=3022769 RepID=A0AA97CZJ9_9ACTN
MSRDVDRCEIGPGVSNEEASVSNERAATRQRLIDAAFTTFAARGFGRSTVQQVCTAAGFTRGAFYSNFDSMDELYMTVWRQEAGRMIESVRIVGASLSEMEGLDLHTALSGIESMMPMSMDWFRVSTEFTALATRRPEILEMVEAREVAIRQELGSFVELLLSRVGRRAFDMDEFCLVLIAAHEGTLVQYMIEPDSTAVHSRRIRLFTALVEAYTYKLGE